MEYRLHKPGVTGSSPVAASSPVRVQFDEPVTVYHEDRDYLGSTQIKVADQSALVFNRRVNLREGESEQSDALALGSLWHTLLEIGIDRFGERAVVAPPAFCTGGGALSTKKEAKEWRAEQPADAIVLTTSQSDTLGEMWEGFAANSAAGDLYCSITHREVSLRWESTAGVKVRCRPDAICEGGRLVDFKSTRHSTPLRDFKWAVKDYGYGLSAALYEQGCVLAGLAEPPMHFVVTSTASLETQVLTLPQSYMDFCRQRLEQLLLEIAERRVSGNWNPVGYGAIHEIEMPGFAERSGSSYVE